MDIKRTSVLERNAGMTNTTRLAIGLQVLAVDGFGQDTRAGSFTHTTRTTEQKRLRQLVIFDGVFKRIGNMLLTYNGFESCRAVFACRNNEIIHCR